MDKMKIYNKLPVGLQNLACSVVGRSIERERYGQEFEAAYSYHQAMDGKPLIEIKEYQKEKLRALLIHSYEHVPYYRELFKNIAFDPYSFDDLMQMEKIPVLTKAMVRQNYDKFFADDIDRSRLVTIYTGGTTGASLKVQKSQKEDSRKWAIWWRYRNRIGITRTMTEARFATRPIVPVSQKRPPYWRWNDYGRVMYFSQYHLTADTVETYCEVLKNESIEWIHGYASIIARLAFLMDEKRLRLHIPHITCGAENLYASQAKLIERVLGTRPFQHYGQVECAANFSQHPDGKIRIDEDFCYVEFFPDSGRHLVVGTNLHEYGMPLIRYSTGDCASLSAEQDGGWRIVEKIDGREVECVQLKTGGTISAEAFDTHIFAYLHIGGAQIIQDSLDAVQVNIIPAQEFSDKDEELLQMKLREIVGADMIIDVRLVDRLVQEKNGKCKLILSRL